MSLYSIFKQGVSMKPRFIPFPSNPPITNKELDYYISLFQYNETQKNLAEQRGSVSGIHDLSTNRLYFDFDSKDDIQVARKDALTLANRLVELQIDPDAIEACFTGQKGFSIEIRLDKRISNPEFKAAVIKLAGDLKTFDRSVMDSPRIVRVKGTKHPKSGLYKIALPLYELDELTIEQIVEKSKTNAGGEDRDLVEVSLPESFFKVEKKKDRVQQPNDLKESLEKIPKGWKHYKWALASGFFEPGERHNALMVIAATCRGLGYDKETAYYICKSAMKKQAARSGDSEFPKEELWVNIIDNSVYSDTWEGGQYSPSTNPWLNSYCQRMGFEVKKEEETKARRIQDIQDEFQYFVEHIEENTILTGIPCLDRAMPITTGNNLGIVGSASSGKTSISLEILKNTSKAGVVSVFASLDMHRNRLFEKLLYKTTGLSRGDLYAKIKAGEIEAITKKIKEDYSNVWFYDRSCPTVADIRDYIEEVENETGRKVKLVMLDYFERVNSERSEDTAASKDIAGQLQDLVNDFNIALVTLVQPNKFSLAGGPDKPIRSYTAIKGSSFLYQSFRNILALWRPFFTTDMAEHDKFMQMAILKNDLGEIGSFNFTWNGKKGDIKECTEEDLAELKRLLELKSANEAAGKTMNEWE